MNRRHVIPVVAVLAAGFCLLRNLPSSIVHATQQTAPASAVSTPKDQSGAPTWSRDIAPVLYKNCTTCHHAGGAGPFSLITYGDARRWGPQVLVVTQSRFMPPWLPQPGYGDFADVRRLSDSDRSLIQRWVANKMPEGNASEAPAPPHYDATWQFGKPDLILKVPSSFTLPAGGTERLSQFHSALHAAANSLHPRHGDQARCCAGGAPRQRHC